MPDNELTKTVLYGKVEGN